jgi:glycosyltransferase involved in cell wall biosynthesis
LAPHASQRARLAAPDAHYVNGASRPKLSVVIPTFNNEGTLGRALASLAEQTERDFEVVISDGGSRDATLAVAASWQTRLPAIRVLTRPDRGVYDAINLGVEATRGEWVLILGSDDRLHTSGTLAQVLPLLLSSTAAIVYGDVRMVNRNRLGVPPGGRYAGPMPLARLLRGNICQQAMFYRRQLVLDLGGFDLAYPVMADWDFNLRAAFHAPMQWIDVVVADYAATGMSARREDLAAIRGVPEMVRCELLARSGDRTLWPLHRILLRQADVLRRRGLWRDALRQIRSWLRLMLWRHLRERTTQRPRRR